MNLREMICSAFKILVIKYQHYQHLTVIYCYSFTISYKLDRLRSFMNSFIICIFHGGLVHIFLWYNCNVACRSLNRL